MRALSSKANVEAPSVDFPHGRIKDKAGAVNGTPVNEAVYGDIHQFFQELMARAGLTPNGNPDNATNGYQLVDALQTLCGVGPFAGVTGNGVLPLLTYNNSAVYSVAGGSYVKYKKIGKLAIVEVFISFLSLTSGTAPQTVNVALPSGLTMKNSPTYSRYVFRGDYVVSGTPTAVDVSLADNKITYARGSSITGPCTLAFVVQFECN